MAKAAMSTLDIGGQLYFSLNAGLQYLGMISPRSSAKPNSEAFAKDKLQMTVDRLHTYGRGHEVLFKIERFAEFKQKAEAYRKRKRENQIARITTARTQYFERLNAAKPEAKPDAGQLARIETKLDRLLAMWEPKTEPQQPEVPNGRAHEPLN